MDIKCLTCGKDVVNVTKRRKFCSQKCANIKRYVPKAKTGSLRKCAYCGKEIYTKRCKLKFINIFCCREHQLNFYKQNAFSENCVICGKIFYCQPCQINYRHRKTCSISCRSKLRTLEARKNRIKNGFTQHQIDRCVRSSKEANDWRKAVFAKDDYICQICKKRGGYLEAHHIKQFAHYPKLRFELSNGKTLCRKCHDKTKEGGPIKKPALTRRVM